jgi:hypothetical protein
LGVRGAKQPHAVHSRQEPPRAASSSTISASHAGRKAIRAVGRLGARFAAPVGFVGAATVVVAVVATVLFVR